MDNAVTIEDVTGDDAEFVRMDFIVENEDMELEDVSFHSAWNQSVRTTQSTRDRLALTENEVLQLHEDLEAREIEIQEKEAEKQINLRQIDNLEKQAEAITAEKDAHIADLLRQLEVARAAPGQVNSQQQTKPEGETRPPPAPMISQPHHQPRNCLLYTSPSPRDGLLSRMPSSA